MGNITCTTVNGQLTCTDRPGAHHVPSFRQPLPTGPYRPPGFVFATASQAAIDAIAHARNNGRTQRLEYGGWILRVPGGFTYAPTDPASARGGHSGPSSMNLGDMPREAIGAYHTHPRGGGAEDAAGELEKFSTNDLELARWLWRQGRQPGLHFLGTPYGRVRVAVTDDGQRVATKTVAGPAFPGEGPNGF